MASLQRTHYENLGVARDAPLAHIKQAYYAAVLKYHPDKATAVSNTARAQEQPAEGDEPCGAAELDGDLVASTSKVFELVQKAWEVLRDAGRRAAYDSELSLQELQAPLSYQDELDLGELDEEVDADGTDVYTYPCRCGDRYTVPKSEINDHPTAVVPCRTCSNHVLVRTATTL
eukprot:XP_001690783.1 DnaJ-like protein [Chlamydomonas reinhardtii]